MINGMSIRERLAIARARSVYSVCAAEARADVVGVCLMRFIDNKDPASGMLAARALSSSAARSRLVDPRLARRDARAVLRYLWDSRCLACLGRRYLIHDSSGVFRICLACDATGYAAPFSGTLLAQIILIDARKRMGWAIDTARRELVAG